MGLRFLFLNVSFLLCMYVLIGDLLIRKSWDFIIMEVNGRMDWNGFVIFVCYKYWNVLLNLLFRLVVNNVIIY